MMEMVYYQLIPPRTVPFAPTTIQASVWNAGRLTEYTRCVLSAEARTGEPDSGEKESEAARETGEQVTLPDLVRR